MTLQVIGAGYGRTGTTSLREALNQLGLGPCFHMFEVFNNPDRAQFFTEAAAGKTVDWDACFDGFNSAVDWPTSRFYSELAEYYPNAKVILSDRDPDSWHRSCMNTIAFRNSEPHATQEPDEDPVEQMIDAVIWRGTFDRRFDDKEHAVAIYQAHNREVVERIPPERLLVFDLKQGWEPLCSFLGVAVPNVPFPHANDTASFRRDVLHIESDVTA